MKKIIITLLTVMILLSVSSCKTEYQEEKRNIKDALRISAYLFPEGTEEPLSWDDDTVFELEQLKLNEVRILAPGVLMNMEGMNMLFECDDGIFEIICENEDVELSFGNVFEPWYQGKDNSKRTCGFTVQLPNEGYVGVSPAGGAISGNTGWTTGTDAKGYLGKEYYLTVNGYKSNNPEVVFVRAELKLVQLKHYDRVKVLEGQPDYSLFYSIEMVSYEYSDIYKIMGDIPEEEDD